MGKSKDPNNIRMLKGDQHKDRYSPSGMNVEKLTEVPKPPMWLNAKAKLKYKEKCSLLISHKLLTLMDLDSLAMLCALESKIIKLWQAGETPSMSMYSQYKSYSADFGLTVLSRERMPAPSAVNKRNKYSKE